MKINNFAEGFWIKLKNGPRGSYIEINRNVFDRRRIKLYYGNEYREIKQCNLTRSEAAHLLKLYY